MKSILILLGGIALLGVSSCAMVPKEPLAPGEVRLLSIDAIGGNNIKANLSFAVNIFFEAASNPEIKRACFYESGEEPSCFDVSYLTLRMKKAFQVYLPGLKAGSHRVECYAEYLQDGKKQQTNVVSSYIYASSGGF
jgi:hypothetical protein